MLRHTFTAIGTTWHIDIKNTESTLNTSSIFTCIMERVEKFEQSYSRFRKDTLVDKISKEAGVYQFPDDGKKLMQMYRKLYDITESKVTPLIGQTLIDIGYDSTYSLTPKKVIQPVPKWDDVMRYDEDINSLTTFVPVQLDFGAAGKGYVVDIVSDLLLNTGVTEFTVDAGGDIYHHGETIQIGLEHPDNPQLAIGIANISNKSICGSSGNRRRWNKYHHIINPESQESPSSIKALWVVADTAMVADGLTTALFFVDANKLKEAFTFEHVIMLEYGSAFISKNFPGSLF